MQHHFFPNNHNVAKTVTIAIGMAANPQTHAAPATNQPLCSPPLQPAGLVPLCHGHDCTACLLSTRIECKHPNDDQAPPAYNTSLIPFWNIFFLFNHSLSCKNHPFTQSIATPPPKRITKLGQGRIRELRNKAFAFPEQTPDLPGHTITDDDQPSFNNATQFCPEAHKQQPTVTTCTLHASASYQPCLQSNSSRT
jgi:hypothetical protein